jgi:hypothetical protein
MTHGPVLVATLSKRGERDRHGQTAAPPNRSPWASHRDAPVPPASAAGYDRRAARRHALRDGSGRLLSGAARWPWRREGPADLRRRHGPSPAASRSLSRAAATPVRGPASVGKSAGASEPRHRSMEPLRKRRAVRVPCKVRGTLRRARSTRTPSGHIGEEFPREIETTVTLSRARHTPSSLGTAYEPSYLQERANRGRDPKASRGGIALAAVLHRRMLRRLRRLRATCRSRKRRARLARGSSASRRKATQAEASAPR